MKFSIALPVKNEAQSLPGLLESLKEFREKGGEIIIVDTGSTDETVSLAQAAGCRVECRGDLFIRTITEEDALGMNSFLIAAGEEPVVSVGDRIFDFSAARNCAASLASNDWVFQPDADERVTMDLVAIEKELSEDRAL